MILAILSLSRVTDLDDGSCEEAEVAAGWPDLGAVGNKDGGGEVADHAAGQVHDAGPLSARQLLQVPHQPILEDQGDGQVEDPGKYIRIE